ncbi:MAG: YdcF family protein [Bacteroidales bacterium]|nr:YdcF family protein [Bacteroidales bacterium]
MFYILSRLLACLASPILYILAMLGIALYTRKKGLRIGMVVGAVVLFLLSTNRPLFFAANKAWCDGCVWNIDTTQHYDYAILPGGMTGVDTLRWRVEYGEAADRIVDCAWLMNIGVVDKMIVTGDGASCMSGDTTFFRRHMQEVYGISPERVLIERRAKNTMENFILTIEQFGDQMAGKKILVINSARYMRRTMLCCETVGLECDYYTVDINTTVPLNWEEWVPNFNTLDEWMKLAHEWIGYVAYMGHSWPKPNRNVVENALTE